MFFFLLSSNGTKREPKAYKKEIKLQKQKRQKIRSKKKVIFILMCQIFVNFDFIVPAHPSIFVVKYLAQVEKEEEEEPKLDPMMEKILENFKVFDTFFLSQIIKDFSSII